MIKAAILAGRHNALPRLVQLLHAHPDVELMAYVDSAEAEKSLDELYPTLTGETELTVTSDLDTSAVDVVFIADEPGAAARFVAGHTLPAELCVIDMTGDFRLPDNISQGGSLGQPDSLTGADSNAFIQGIPELNRKAMVRGARHVAMPDAATTAIALGLLPLAKNLLLNSDVSSSYATDDDNAEAEGVTASLIADDVATQLRMAMKSLQNSFDSDVSGVAFSGDLPQGLTAVTTVNTGVDIDRIRELYEDFYDDHNFTFVVDSVPDARDVRGTNKCFIHLDKKDNRLKITTVIDTDMKGGAGNAVHVMNLLFGLIEKVGL